jgi:signal transduction histidine kinase
MGGRLAARRRFRGVDPLVVDGGLAAVLATIALVELSTSIHCPCVSASDAWWTALFIGAQTVPLMVRRRYPFAVFLVVSISAIVYDLLHIPPDPYTPIFAVLVAVYTVSAYAERRLAIIAAVIAGVALVVLNLPPIAGDQDFGDLVNQFVLLGGAWLVGENTRRRRSEASLLRERAERAERERAERERLVVLEERERLAREIHDVLAHSVSVIAVQAGSARAIAEQRPDQARKALASIEQVSKQTMAELRSALDAFGPSDGQASLEPSPGIAAIPDLVERVRSAGLLVDLRQEGDPRPIPGGVDLAVYRLVQESLTNVMKHSAADQATVRLEYGRAWLDVSVWNASESDRSVGRTSPLDAAMSRGRGLIGLRERVAMAGGSFEAGPVNGRFSVRARFPRGVDEGSR